MFQSNTARIRLVGIITGLSILAGCATPPPPSPPPPPLPPQAKVIPYRPVPPGGAALGMYIPPRGPDGIRRSVNSGVSTSQALWNLRSGLNVAALNCQSPQHAGILPAYSSLLSDKKQTLKRANDVITREYKALYGTKYRDQFDGYMTQVYNYFALPPAQYDFCNTALQVATAAASVPAADLENFAVANLPVLDRVFDNFYSRYEQYEADAAAWDAQYAQQGAVPVTTFAPIMDVNVTPSTSATVTSGSSGG